MTEYSPSSSIPYEQMTRQPFSLASGGLTNRPGIAGAFRPPS